jgi:uncharacterized protein YdeI (BOF family)
VDTLAVMDIADAQDVAKDKHVMVEGVITLVVPGNKGFFIYDGTGYMYVRDTSFYDNTFTTTYAVGDKVKFVGARDNIVEFSKLLH